MRVALWWRWDWGERRLRRLVCKKRRRKKLSVGLLADAKGRGTVERERDEVTTDLQTSSILLASPVTPVVLAAASISASFSMTWWESLPNGPSGDG